MDKEFVKYLMAKRKYPGSITKTTFDTVFGQITGVMRASVGLESVFVAKETKLVNDV